MHAACVSGLRAGVLYRHPLARARALGASYLVQSVAPNCSASERKSVVALARTERFVKASSGTGMSKKFLDAHLHVWPSPETYTYPEGKQPPLSLATTGTAESLLSQFELAGVDGALIVQPINLGYDHSYVTGVITRFPTKFVGCCLADPSVNGGGASALQELLTPTGVYRAVRFNPGLWPEGERMTNSVGREMFKVAGERDAFVGFMCFHGLHLHLEDIKDLLAEFPDTRVMMDHFGFVKGTEDPNWQALLSLHEYPQVTIKASAQFRVATDDAKQWPYTSTGEQVRNFPTHDVPPP